MVADHVAVLVEQLRTIVTAGVDSGDFTADDPGAAAHAVFDATLAFHHPAHAATWAAEGIDTRFNGVCTLLIDGLRAR